MKVSDLRLWDAAEYLVEPEAQAEYLKLAFESGDPVEVQHALSVIARARSLVNPDANPDD